MPKVSVIIPVYGAERYIERCARSLFEQTLDDIEYIFVDDCTPDKSMEVLERVMDDYPDRRTQTRLFKTSRNSGQHIARQIGIEACTGEYVTHCDPDDAYSQEDALEIAYNAAIAENSDIVWWDLLVENENTSEQNVSCQKCGPDINNIVKSFLTDFSIMASLCNRIVRREIVKSVSIVNPVSPINEDTLLVTQYHLLSKRCVYIPRGLYVYIRRAGSTTSLEFNRKRLIEKQCKVKANLDLVFEIINKIPNLSKKLRPAIVYRKFHVKSIVIPAVIEFNDCSLWTRVYPEINGRIFVNPYISLRNKILSFTLLSRIFGILHKK